MMTDTKVADRYILQRELGAGGMGKVYQAFDIQANQIVAIKELRPEMTTKEHIQRFKREGEALRDLNHPNIVKMLDAIEEDNKYYLVMEYIAGGDLKKLLEQQRKVDYQRCINMAIDLADALTRAHRLDIIHRDIKPSNILMDETGTIKLADFGIAYVEGKELVTDTERIIGTLDYLPAELFDGGTYNTLGDIWAFGVILFEMLSGERPFRGQTIVDVIQSIATQPVPDLEKLCPDLPIPLIDLVYRMLEKDPNARISSVRHVGAILEDIHAGRVSSRFETKSSTLDTISHLPAQSTPFIGREVEVMQLKKLLQDSRLITILAPGGMGKTRLSLEAAQQAIDMFEDGAYFVDLIPVTAVQNIPQAIADAFAYQMDGQSPEQQIYNLLAAKKLLLILDNFEHVIEGAGFITQILKHAPNVKIIVTSRVRLSQSGETLFHLSGMDFPKFESPEDAREYAAIKLFMSSATRALPTFELLPDNLDSITRICRLVQGMPLGIVLAAAWLSMLTPAEIADEIQQSLDFLETIDGELPDRQRSIRVVCDYAWASLQPEEQHIFAYLSVFKGGFTRDAAQSVTQATLRNLMTLVNKSLIIRDSTSGRYHIHELLRQFAYEKLADNTTDAHEKHARYFAKILSSLDVYSHGQLNALQQIDADFDNIIQAWDWSVDHLDEDALGGLFESLTVYLSIQQNVAFPIKLEQQLPALKGKISPVLYTHMQLIVFLALRDVALVPQVDEYIILLKEHQAFRQLAFAYLVKARLLGSVGHMEEAYTNLNLCRDISIQTGEKWREGEALVTRGYIESTVYEDYERAQATYQEAYALFEEIGNQNFLAWVALNIGEIERLWGNYDESEKYYNQSLKISLVFKHYLRAVMTLDSLADIAIVHHNYQKAAHLAEENLQIAQRTSNHMIIGIATGIWGRVHIILGHYEEAYDIMQDAIEQIGHLMPSSTREMLLIYQAAALVGMQDLEAARRLFKAYFPARAKSEQPAVLISSMITMCVLMAEDGKTTLARSILNSLIDSPIVEFMKDSPFITDISACVGDVPSDQTWDDFGEMVNIVIEWLAD